MQNQTQIPAVQSSDKSGQLMTLGLAGGSPIELVNAMKRSRTRWVFEGLPMISPVNALYSFNSDADCVPPLHAFNVHGMIVLSSNHLVDDCWSRIYGTVTESKYYAGVYGIMHTKSLIGCTNRYEGLGAKEHCWQHAV